MGVSFLKEVIGIATIKKLGIWFGRKGGKILCLTIALMTSGSYNWIKEILI